MSAQANSLNKDLTNLGISGYDDLISKRKDGPQWPETSPALRLTLPTMVSPPSR